VYAFVERFILFLLWQALFLAALLTIVGLIT
jgi:hypothetical protein